MDLLFVIMAGLLQQMILKRYAEVVRQTKKEVVIQSDLGVLALNQLLNLQEVLHCGVVITS